MMMIASALLTGLGAGEQVARGDFLVTLSDDVSRTAGGQYLYQYTLTNEDASDLNAFSFILNVSTGAALDPITGPPGWEITYALGDSVISWDSLSSLTDLTPGASALFTFVSPLGPGPQDYAVLGSDAAGISFGSVQATTLGPSAVPEPSTLLLCSIGLLGLLGYVGWPRHPLRRRPRPDHRDTSCKRGP
jgi:hypothetical protein